MQTGEGIISKIDTLPLNHITHVLEVAQAKGADLTPYLEKYDLADAVNQGKPEEIPREAYYGLVESVLDTMDIPALGALVGRKFSITDYGILGYACIHSPTLGQCMRTFFRFQQIVGSDSTYTEALIVEGETAKIEVKIRETTNPVLNRFDAEQAAGQWTRAGEELYGTQASLFSRVNFSFSRPSYAAELEDMFGCPVYFNQPLNQLLFPSARLTEPVSLANELMAQLCAQQCENILNNLQSQGGLAESVRRLIVSQSGRTLVAEEVASQLHISSRTLRRRLQEEGTNFKEIYNEVRMSTAMEYLRQTDLSAQEIAFLLGYSDIANFHRAFKKWSSQTPGEYRESANTE